MCDLGPTKGLLYVQVTIQIDGNFQSCGVGPLPVKKVSRTLSVWTVNTCRTLDPDGKVTLLVCLNAVLRLVADEG